MTSVGSTVSTVLTTSFDTPQPSLWDKYRYYIIGGTAGAVGLAILIVLVIVVAIKSRGATQSEREGREAAKAIIEKAKPLHDAQLVKAVPLAVYVPLVTNHPTMTKAADFKKEVSKVNGLSGQSAIAYMDTIRYKKSTAPQGDADMKRVLDLEFVQNQETAKKVRHPEYEITECTQTPVVGQHIREKDHDCLHANILHGLFGHEFILSQAPSKQLFDFHWEMIWQRKVGVIVWLGPLGTSKAKIEPYISLLPGEQSAFGRFEVKTLSAVHYQRLYNTYTLAVRNKHVFTTVDFRGQENRQMFVIHIDPWLKNRKKQASVGRVALVVEMVRALALQQKQAGMPAVLTHCSTGLEQSGTFFAMYLSRQFYLRFNTVNVMAVLKMIERERYKAFASVAAFDQIQVLHAVLLELIEKYPRAAGAAQASVRAVDVLKFERHLLQYLPKRTAAVIAAGGPGTPKAAVSSTSGSGGDSKSLTRKVAPPPACVVQVPGELPAAVMSSKSASAPSRRAVKSSSKSIV